LSDTRQARSTEEHYTADYREDGCESSDSCCRIGPLSHTVKHDMVSLPASDVGEAGRIFEAHRDRLFRIAYRMLGSRADADDLVQDAYLRWHRCSTSNIQSPLAFLVTVTTRLCLDRLRALKQERARYTGPWVPEPIIDDHAASPETQFELADEVSIGFLAVLERLGPEERAVFLLHDVFDYDYSEVAEVMGKAAPSCRQMIHRARARVREAQPRFAVTAESRERLLKKFLAAASTTDRQVVMALLAEDSGRPFPPLPGQHAQTGASAATGPQGRQAGTSISSKAGNARSLPMTCLA
jgi:RNA polymerase sigma factor (sigma-70 family)